MTAVVEELKSAWTLVSPDLFVRLVADFDTALAPNTKGRRPHGTEAIK